MLPVESPLVNWSETHLPLVNGSQMHLDSLCFFTLHNRTQQLLTDCFACLLRQKDMSSGDL